ncbi:hypothetical protein B5807_07843 [Epicoccum nigrum]|uniref:Uncharacterized protein n=1 Tax=Epicoccum nigrum TaxID=105696 RepID=A0A1Y2LWD3_EPING|nr:hypothetical protein B5807_07843 [Epicoccum nigrum]
MKNRAAAHERRTNIMDSPKIDIHAHFNNAIRKQTSPNVESELSGLLTCPYGHGGRMFQNFQQLLDHASVEHASEISGLNNEQAHLKLQEAVASARYGESTTSVML